jgi:hypothetical protein
MLRADSLWFRSTTLLERARPTTLASEKSIHSSKTAQFQSKSTLFEQKFDFKSYKTILEAKKSL